MIRRRIPGVSGHEAALLVEATKLALKKSIAVQTYVTQIRPLRRAS